MTSLTRGTLLTAAVAAALGTARAGERPAVADADVKAWVDNQVAQRQPGPQDRRFDEVGWVTTITEAERLARKHNRPVFLFTHDGRMNVGRC
jgi:hypothetical protein